MPEKLVIRVVNAPSPDQQDEPKPKVIVEYHWNRIFVAMVLLVAVLAGLVWGGWHLFKRADNLPVAIESTANSLGTATQPQAESHIIEDLSTKGSAAKATVNAEATGGKPFKIDPLPSSSIQSAPLSAPNQQPTEDAVVSAQPAQTSTESSVAILSDTIKMAQLTSGVRDDKPIDKLSQTIPMNEKGLIRVYLFMETDGLKGNVLFHDWLWKGKRIAHARIPIKRKTHTAASSKFIDRIMLGPWEVKIVDERNRVLAKTAFEVK